MIHLERSEAEDIVRNFLKDTMLEVMAILNAESGSLFLLDGKNKELVLESFQHAKKLMVHDVRKRVGEGISGKVMQIKTPVLVKDIDNDQRFSRNGFSHYHTKSFLSIPLVGPQNMLLGVINISDKKNSETFTEKDLEFATTIAEYACIIAYNLVLADQLKKEKEEIDKEKSLLEKYASVGKLAAGVVHEINNPLDGIIRFTNMLLKQPNMSPVAHEYLEEIKRGLIRIESTTKSLLQFSHQVNRNHNKDVVSYVDIHELIEEALSVFRGRMGEAITVNKDLASFPILIQDMGLAHVFMNIIKNAIDAIPGKGRLDIATEQNEFFVNITFKDSGIGIPEHIRQQIFEPFFTTKDQEKGTGLGLSICKEIVDRYEGNIDVNSKPSEGSIFTITIPAKFLKPV